jgi:DNA-binding PadR family transcriptional regulator
MPVKHALLGLLARGPLHGYELKTAFEAELVPRSSLNFGQVYTSLERLQKEGLVAHEVVTQEERPDKKVFRLTESGALELRCWLGRASLPGLDLRNETFLKLAVARRLPDGEPLQVLDVERRAAFAQLREVTEARVNARAEGEPVELVLLLELAALRLEAFITWLERCDEALRADTGGVSWQ